MNDNIKRLQEQIEAEKRKISICKHYSIITTPINELVGEISKRPDTYRCKAFDDDSKAEELQFKTQLLQDFILNKAKQKIMEN